MRRHDHSHSRGDLEAAADDLAAEVFEQAESSTDEYDVEITTEVQFGHPARTVLNRAVYSDVIVIGTHGGSLADRLFVGNIAQKVFRDSLVAVSAVR